MSDNCYSLEVLDSFMLLDKLCQFWPLNDRHKGKRFFVSAKQSSSGLL